MKRWTIYCHIHIATGRRYVGLTSQTMERRWSEHICKSKSAKGGRWHFPNAIRAYGPKAFSHVALMVLDSLDEANVWEDFWIEFLDTRNPDCGFNLAKGGHHIPHPKKNPWDRPEFRKKMTPLLRELNTDPIILSRQRAAYRDALGKPEFRVKVMDPVVRAQRSRDSRAHHDSIKASRPVSIVDPPRSKPRPVYDGPVKDCAACHRPGEFGRDRHAPDGFKYVCKTCESERRTSRPRVKKSKSAEQRERDRVYQATHYVANKGHIRALTASRAGSIAYRRAEWRRKLLELVRSAKSTPCISCGAMHPPDQMDLVRPGRSHTIESMIHASRAKAVIEEEIAGSRPVCAGCLQGVYTSASSKVNT